MPFDAFLRLVSVVKMLYGKDAGLKLFEGNISEYADIIDISNLHIYIESSASLNEQ